MSKVTNSPQDGNASKSQSRCVADQILEQFTNPLSVLTEHKPLSFWKCYAWQMQEKAQDKIKPGMKASARLYEEMVFFSGVAELFALLEETPGIVALLQKHIAFLDKALDERQRMIDETLQVCRDWREIAMEDGPTDGEYLKPANLAMRLQRPHKAN